MKPYDGSEIFVPLRIGLMEHIAKGKMSFTEYSTFIFLLMLADRTTGTVMTNARIISETIRENIKSVRWTLGQLRAKGYIFYEDRRGMRGAHLIFLDNYRIRLDKSVFFYTEIFRDRSFIGEDRFFAQLKLCQLHPKTDEAIRVSIKFARLSEKFEIEFPAKFEEMLQRLDEYTKNDSFNRYLAEFKAEFPAKFEHDVCRITEKEIEIIIQKKQKDSSKGKRTTRESSDENPKEAAGHRQATTEEKKEMGTLCDRLNKEYGGDFNAFQFVQRYINADIPGSVINHVLRQILKHRPDSPWAYGNKVLKEEFSTYQYHVRMEKHEALKRMDLASLPALQIVDD